MRLSRKPFAAQPLPRKRLISSSSTHALSRKKLFAKRANPSAACDANARKRTLGLGIGHQAVSPKITAMKSHWTRTSGSMGTSMI